MQHYNDVLTEGRTQMQTIMLPMLKQHFKLSNNTSNVTLKKQLYGTSNMLCSSLDYGSHIGF